MTMVLDVISALLILGGACFFTAGTIGLLRFPDVRSQLHALTKADNLGLGMILLGVALQLGSWTSAGLLLITWLLALGAASVSAQILSGIELRHDSARGRPGDGPYFETSEAGEAAAGEHDHEQGTG